MDSSGWAMHENWRRSTAGAMQVFVTRASLIESVVSEGRPRTLDEYVGAMRRAYLRFNIHCPVDVCRAFVRYVIPDEYKQSAA